LTIHRMRPGPVIRPEQLVRRLREGQPQQRNLQHAQDRKVAVQAAGPSPAIGRLSERSGGFAYYGHEPGRAIPQGRSASNPYPYTPGRSGSVGVTPISSSRSTSFGESATNTAFRTASGGASACACANSADHAVSQGLFERSFCERHGPRLAVPCIPSRPIRVTVFAG
jgi:hypothetical protein